MTPKPTNTPIPIPYTAVDINHWIDFYSNKESVNKDLLRKIAWCESKFNPLAVNGIYVGLFQFAPNTWMTLRRILNLNTDISLRFNPEESIRTAAFKLALNGLAAWPNCSK